MGQILISTINKAANRLYRMKQHIQVLRGRYIVIAQNDDGSDRGTTNTGVTEEAQTGWFIIGSTEDKSLIDSLPRVDLSSLDFVNIDLE